MKNIDLWFGGSYLLGSELAIYYNEYTLNLPNHRFVRPHRDRPELAFPHLVSQARNADYINFGRGGAALGWQLYSLIQFCKNELTSDCCYTAFFSLPFAERTFLIDNNGDHHHIHIPEWDGHHTYLEFVTYDTTLVLNQIFLMCIQHNITPHFFPELRSFKINKEVNIVPKSAWLLSPDTCLVNESWDLKKDVYSWRSITEILSKQSVFLKYIKPCGNHPNLYGHRVIADKILEELEKRNL